MHWTEGVRYATGDTESELEVFVVMREVVFLHFAHVCRERCVMQARRQTVQRRQSKKIRRHNELLTHSACSRIIRLEVKDQTVNIPRRKTRT